MTARMGFLRPSTWDDAVAARAEHPDAAPIAGGTDLMVAINLGRYQPAALLDLSQVDILRDWGADGPWLRIGAGVTYRRILNEVGSAAPALALAARTVGSPQIRNRGTVGGNLGTASPAGDAHPPLLASGALVEVASVRGIRRVPVAEFFAGPKRTVLAHDELIAAVLLGRAAGPQQFAKVGGRNAMVIAICSLALALDAERGTVRTGIGSAASTPVRAPAAEELLAGELPWASRGPLPGPLAKRFGELVAAATSPVDDQRGSAAYRRHALAVLARRMLSWAWEEYRCTSR